VTVSKLFQACLLILAAGFPSVAFGAAAGDAWVKFWDPCEAVLGAVNLVQQVDAGDIRYALSIGMNDSIGNSKCPPKGLTVVAQAEANDLGPSLVGPDLPSMQLLGVPSEQPARDCPRGDDDHAQRDELRFKDGSPLIHRWDQPTWYSLTFHMTGQIYPCGSARWVIGQWKQWTNGNESPVLAQRFDNGILHVTVQDGNCRCVVAKAHGDPDALGLLAFTSSAGGKLTKSHFLKCLDSAPTDEPNPPEKKCVPEFPVDLSVWTIGGGPPPELPDPKKGFVTMTYLVSGGPKGLIDIYAEGQFVARVQGNIGFPDTLRDTVKFKIGQYRAKVPGSAELSVSRLCVSQKVGDCEPALRPDFAGDQ
jgi:hypothetical protein